VLTQYKSHSLDTHLAKTWRMSPLLGNYVAPVPAQMRTGRSWFAGSADAIFQNLNIIRDEKPDYICVFGADNLYRMDARRWSTPTSTAGAGVTVAGLRVPIEQAFRSGSSNRARTAASARSTRSRATRSGWPTTPRRCSPRWATTSSPPRR
jgi:glucose-1-phosphate adenylyltransferase